MSLMQVWFSFDGRINRSTFWLKWWLPLVTASAFVYLVVLWVVLQEVLLGSFLLFVFPAWGLLYCWTSMAAYAKRWHDHDMSGWWTALLFVPLVGFFWGFYVFIKLGFLKGTDGPNRYGHAPK